MVVLLTAAMIMCAGLVVDGGRVFAANRRAHDDAAGAARAGAQALSVSDLRATGTVTLDPDAATAAAQDYLTAAGVTGTVEVNGDEVAVTVSITTRMLILGLGGIGSRTVTAQETARAVHGITGPEP
jgi:Flp pilus assembly protein TadG